MGNFQDNQPNQNLELGEVEGYRNNSDGKFSHEALVMRAMNRVVEIAGHEMIRGYNISTTDPKTGYVKVTYVEDTRSAFIESVRTCEMIMACDLDEDALKKIKELREANEKNKKDLLQKQTTFWVGLNDSAKSRWINISNKEPVTRDTFHKGLQYYELHEASILQLWRNIFAELSKLTSRLDFYKAEIFEG